MFRYRKNFTNYHNQPEAHECPFCGPDSSMEIVRETKYAQIVKNTYQYDLWELRDVTEHLMVLPKRHVKSLGDLSTEELADIAKIIAEYESNNYNIYARAVDSVQRSVPAHQHTHLIKTTDKHANFTLYVKKPYWLIKV